MPNKTNVRCGKQLAKAVQTANTSAEIKSILKLAKAELGGLHWRDLGDRPNNAGTVEIASSAASALVERVTNAIDAMLEMKAEEATGPLPDSPRQAARDWFKVPARGIGEMDGKARRALASNISVTLEDSGETARPTVRVKEGGIGQQPLDWHATLLSLNGNNKIAKPYLQGAYGQGAAATYRFGRYTLIISRRKPSLLGGREDLVGWTIVWEDPGDLAVDKLARYRYLVDADGEIPAFEPTQLADASWHGTEVVHIGYDLRGYTAGYNQPKNGIWALFHSALFDPVLPFLVGGNRKQDAGAAGAGTTRVVIGNAARLNNPDKMRGDLSVTYSNSETFDLAKATGRALGRFEIRYWVLQRPPGSTSKSEPTASYVTAEHAVTMTLSGQRQDAESRVWMRNRIELPFLVGNLIVQIDVDELARLAKRELFASTRERAVESELRDLIYNEVAVVLRTDSELRRLEREERERLLAAATEKVDDKVRQRLAQWIKTLRKDKKRLVTRLVDAPEPPGSGGKGKGRETDDTGLPAVPTMMRFTRDPVTVKQGSGAAVWVEINARNGYLPEHVDDLTTSFDTTAGGKLADVAKSKLLGGKSLWKIQATPDAPLGEHKMTAVLVTTTGVIQAETMIKVIEAPPARKRKVTTEEPEQGPEVRWIHRDKWLPGWDEKTVGEVMREQDATLILVNRDQHLLERALDQNKKLTAEQIETRANRYLLPVACALYEQDEAARQLKQAPDADYVAGELERLATAVLLVIDQDALDAGL